MMSNRKCSAFSRFVRQHSGWNGGRVGLIRDAGIGGRRKEVVVGAKVEVEVRNAV